MGANQILLRGWTSIESYQKGILKYPDIKEARDFYLYDFNGQEYIDGKSQMMNVSFGHNVPSLNEALSNQLKKIAYIPTMDGHGNYCAEEYAQKLLSILDENYKSVYLSSSGTACCEVAIQIARDYHRIQGKRKKNKILSITGCYHGNSAMMSEISQYSSPFDAYRINDKKKYLKLMQPYCYRCGLGLNKDTCKQECADEISKQLEVMDAGSICAIILEFIQGNGMIALPSKYVNTLREFTAKNDILLIADEVLTGFARTGSNFAFEKYNIRPDIICLSKTITNGMLPFGATVFNSGVTEAIRSREIQVGSTQDGNPLCAVVGSAVIDLLKSQNWAERVNHLGNYFVDSLKKAVAPYPIVGEVRGVGLLICIELVHDQKSKKPFSKMDQVFQKYIENGVFVFAEHNYIVFTPPYTITEEIIDKITAKSSDAIKSCIRGSVR